MKYLMASPLIILLTACGGGSSSPANSSASVASSQINLSSSPVSSSSTANISSSSRSSVISGLDARPTNTACLAPAPVQTGTTQIEWQSAFPQLPSISGPSSLFQLPGDSAHWYVMRQAGYIYRFDNNANANQLTQMLNIDPQVDSSGNEMGLLGVAVHPDFSSNRFIFLYYSARDVDNNIQTHVSRFKVNTDGSFDASSEKIFLQFERPFTNHLGGQLAFDHQGYLLIASGDGGSGGDPYENGQNQNTLLGKILRIDVDHTDDGLEYAIPADNPFINQPNKRAEIWAYGLRNPWRFSLDSTTNDLWVGDVGQGKWEEINLVTSGGNYGWGDMEGDFCYEGRSNCSTANKIKPVYSIHHDTGACSVIGGFVYRGSEFPSAYGRYFYTDYCEKTMRSFVRQENGNLNHSVHNVVLPNIVSFAQDNQGELYALGQGSAGQQILRMQVTNAGQTAGSFPDQLSATGCVDANNPKNPVSAMIPYQVESILWSDGLNKTRFLSLPDNTQIDITNSGDFNFPVGSVLMKNFIQNNQHVETRLFAHTALGWQGFSYEWNDQQTDATLLTTGKDKAIGNLLWHFPSPGECMQCHTAAAGFSLGLETSQLNSQYHYESTNRIANQLDSLSYIDLFKSWPTSQQMSQKLFSLTDANATVEQKAKSYLHTNCSNCHRPNATSPVTLDLRFTTPLNQMGICNQPPKAGDLGIANAMIVAAGDPARSTLLKRMQVLDGNKMPPLGRNTVDDAAVSLMSEWIGSLTICN